MTRQDKVRSDQGFFIPDLISSSSQRLITLPTKVIIEHQSQNETKKCRFSFY